jgi:hypothetical protein
LGLISISQYEFDALMLKLDVLPDTKKPDAQTIEIARKILLENKKAADLAIEYGLSPARIYNIRKRIIVAHLKMYENPSQTDDEFVSANAEILQKLDGKDIGNGKKVGRPVSLIGGKKFVVYLDQQSFTIAANIGNGNISDGIRKALLKQNQTARQRTAKTAQNTTTQL